MLRWEFLGSENKILVCIRSQSFISCISSHHFELVWITVGGQRAVYCRYYTEGPFVPHTTAL